jgi:hypothetical protein
VITESLDFDRDSVLARLAIFDRFLFQVVLSGHADSEHSEEKNSYEPEPAFVHFLLHSLALTPTFHFTENG